MRRTIAFLTVGLLIAGCSGADPEEAPTLLTVDDASSLDSAKGDSSTSKTDTGIAKTDSGAKPDTASPKDSATSDTATPTDTGPPVSLGAVRDGIATYYDATGQGNCSFDATTNLDVAAMNMPDYAGSAVCGECIHVVGPSGTVDVRIVDSCPGCNSGHLDLSASAFAKIAAPVLGRVNIKWQVISCKPTGPISYKFKEGSNQWWTAIQIRNHKNPIKTLEAQVAGKWVSIARKDYNYFVAESGLGPGPYTLRVTDTLNQSLVDTGIPLSDGGVAPGAKQFP